MAQFHKIEYCGPIDDIQSRSAGEYARPIALSVWNCPGNRD